MDFVWRIDDAIFRMVGRGVDAWCNVTGTSNFFLARVLLILGWVLIALYFAIRAFEGELNWKVYSITGMFLFSTIGSILTTQMIEEVMRRSEESDALPPLLYRMMLFTRIVRLVMIGAWAFGFIRLAIGNVDVVWLLLSHALLLHGIQYYALYYVNTGGKKRVLRLAPTTN